ncbi:translation initiation factor, aIF-2BII family protein [Nitzschia inconspicua]|uniref:Translation initiation factor, aIF-2BII family protein n=1 Tax=Nitzschia inconspicua TaxID=303405 RepID=A0A9K3L379_9STRA|nr:translation initiation factor, aIF-2BII family protein [Nitzschia inconspicua]
MTEQTKQQQTTESSDGGTPTAFSPDDAKPSADAKKTSKKEMKNKAPPPGLVIKPKPTLTKAERREMQERQRAAKAASKASNQQKSDHTKKGGGDGNQADKMSKPLQRQQEHQVTKSSQASNGKEKITNSDGAEKAALADNSLSLFSHLPQYRKMPDPYAPEWTSTLHPDVIELGMKYASGEIHGDNERCRSMMLCFLKLLDDYVLPVKSSTIDFRTHFDHQVLKLSFQFWTVECRPHSVSMGNAFTFVKSSVASLERDLPLDEAKMILRETIERYLLERLEYADRAIAQHAMTKLQNGDVLLTFGHSEVIDVLLSTAHKEGTDFYVWVADSRPLAHGKKLLKSLQNAGIPCGYVELNALTYILQQVTKVFLGASALMSNGSVYGPVGTAAVALLAKDRHVPVMVCCESYKISNKVQLESITQNELGNPEALLPKRKDKTNRPMIKVLNLVYDVTPSEFVSGIITELGIIPPTSVAVLLSEMNPQDAAFM